MEILKQGLVFRAAEGPFRYQAWPSICQDENGVLYAAWSGLRSSHVCPFGKNLMAVSDDGGETWKKTAKIKTEQTAPILNSRNHYTSNLIPMIQPTLWESAPGKVHMR